MSAPKKIFKWIGIVMGGIVVLIAAGLTYLYFWQREPYPDYQAMNPTAQAISLTDTTWEVNASVQAKGFKQEEKDKKFESRLNGEVVLVSPDGKSSLRYPPSEDFEEVLVTGELQKDRQVDFQFETSVRDTGKFTLKFFVYDLSGKDTTEIKHTFKLLQ